MTIYTNNYKFLNIKFQNTSFYYIHPIVAELWDFNYIESGWIKL